MAKTIPQLTDATTVNAADELIIQQGGITKRATGAELAKGLNTINGTVNVKDFGAVGDGVTDDKAAFEAARDSIPSGGRSIIIVPAPNGDNSYLISSPIATNGRLIHWHFLAGASIVGGSLGKFTFPTRNTEYGATGGRREFSAQAPDAVLGEASHEYREINGGGSTTQGYGVRWNYLSDAFGSGFDIAHGIIGVWNRNTGQDGGYGLTSWQVAIAPINGGATTRWGMFTAEYNAVNRHADHGWSKRRSTLHNWIGIHQIVPEAQLFAQAGTSYDILFGTVYTRSTDLKADGYPARFHNAILCEPNTITAAGRFIYASGRDSDVDASQTPVAVLEADDDWQRGISTRRANLTSGIAYGLGATQLIGWLNSSDAVLNGIYSGTGSPEGVTTAPVGSLFLRRDGGASTTLYVKESGSGNTGWVAK
jgi:hypothetical protein